MENIFDFGSDVTIGKNCQIARLIGRKGTIGASFTQRFAGTDGIQMYWVMVGERNYKLAAWEIAQ